MDKKGTPVRDASQVYDLLNIAGDSIPNVDAVLEQLLNQGKSKRVLILAGTESPTSKTRAPYAVTTVKIKFDSEENLRKCVRMLRWSDERLRARPDQNILWDWQRTYRNKMMIHFGVSWYDKDFYEKRKNAFAEPAHAVYYSAFGAEAKDFKMTHKVLG